MKNRNWLLLRLTLGALLSFASAEMFAADTDSLKTWADVLKDFKTKRVSLSGFRLLGDSNLIKEIEILDLRPDTLHLGMFAHNIIKFTKFQFEEGQSLKTIIAQKLAHPNSSGSSLLMIIRDFWMNDNKIKVTGVNEQNNRIYQTSKVVCLVDVFMKTDNMYLPLCRVDTSIWEKKLLTNAADMLVENSLEIIAGKIEIALKESPFSKRKKADLKTIVNQYYKKPFYAVTGYLPKKGLYPSFEHFKRNNPVKATFNIKNGGKGSSTLFVADGKGDEILTRDVWGVCDGKDMYLMQNGLLFKLYKNDDAFYWIGFKKYETVSSKIPVLIPMGGGMTTMGLETVSGDVRIRLTPNLLNMTTGEEY